MKAIELDKLLAYCENQADHSITPNDFMRMQHIDVDKEALDSITRLLRPYEDTIKRLNLTLEKQNKWNNELLAEMSHLRRNHEDSGLERDKPKHRKWEMQKLSNGDSLLLFYCPNCGMRLPNYFHYCNECGQAVSLSVLDEMEIKHDD